jgi:transposase-like protein
MPANSLLTTLPTAHGVRNTRLLSRRRNWPEVIPFFAFPDDVRRIMYTTNAIETPSCAGRPEAIFPPMKGP